VVEGAGDADALALAAAELVRIAVERVGGQSDAFGQILDLAPPLGAGAQAMNVESFANDGAHGHARVEGADRILEDGLDAGAQRPPFGAVDFRQIHAVDPHGAGGGRDQPQHGAAQGGFAAARFAHQSERLAASQIEIHIVHGPHVMAHGGKDPLAYREPCAQTPHFQHLLAVLAFRRRYAQAGLYVAKTQRSAQPTVHEREND